MSDSGKQIGDCEHGYQLNWCPTCLRAKRDELQASFELRRNADMRAIKRWQSEDPEKRELTWPDHADLCCWLLDQLEQSPVEADCLELLLTSTVNQLDYVMKARVYSRLGHSAFCELDDIKKCHDHQKELLAALKKLEKKRCDATKSKKKR